MYLTILRRQVKDLTLLLGYPVSWTLEENNPKITLHIHCEKSVRIRSYSDPHFPHIFPHSDWILNTPYLSVFSPNAEKMRTRITPNMDSTQWSQSNYSLLWGINYGKILNKYMNRSQEIAMWLIYNNHNSNFQNLLILDHLVS